jgi:hypothetical protein
MRRAHRFATADFAYQKMRAKNIIASCLPKKAKFTPKFILLLMHAEKRETRQRSGNNHFCESQSLARAHFFKRVFT